MQGNISSPSYLIPPSQLVAFPFPSYLIYIEHRNSFLDPSIGSHLSIPCPFTILSHLPFPINSPILYWSLGPATRVARCSNVQLIAVLLHFCAIASIVIFAPAESILDQQLASGGATSAPSGLPRNSSRTSLRRIRNFQFSGFFFHPIFHNLAPQQPISGSAWQRLLRFGGELSPVGLPTIHKSSRQREISRLCFETDFLVLQSGDKLSVNRCMWLLSSRESEAIYSSGLFLPISCPTQARGKSCSRFI